MCSHTFRMQVYGTPTDVTNNVPMGYFSNLAFIRCNNLHDPCAAGDPPVTNMSPSMYQAMGNYYGRYRVKKAKINIYFEQRVVFEPTTATEPNFEPSFRACLCAKLGDNGVSSRLNSYKSIISVMEDPNVKKKFFRISCTQEVPLGKASLTVPWSEVAWFGQGVDDSQQAAYFSSPSKTAFVEFGIMLLDPLTPGATSFHFDTCNLRVTANYLADWDSPRAIVDAPADADVGQVLAD